MKRIGLTVAVLAATIFLTYFAGRGPRASDARAQKRSQASATPGVPDFTLKDLDGHDESLGQFKGKVVLVNFWATWCAPCRIEIPWLMDLQEKYGPQGFTVLGVAMDEEGKSAVAPFIQKERFKIGANSQPVNYPILIGKEAVGDEYGGVPALPESFLIGRDGKIVDKILGLRGKAEIEDSIKKALNTRATTSTASAQ